MKTCLLFPGQGAQFPGMGRELYRQFDAVKTLFTLGSDVTGIDLPEIIFNGTAEQLKATDISQVAITCVNLSAAAAVREYGIEADGCAGFSLGEYAALCVAGVLTPEDTFRLVRQRGDAMEKCSRALDGAGTTAGMAAVIGIAPEKVAEITAGIEGVYTANYNSPVQAVISGNGEAVAAAMEQCRAAGARRVIPLKVSGPFHTPLLQPAAEEFAAAVNATVFADPKQPVWSNVTGARIETGAAAAEMCIRQITSPVLWTQEEQAVVDAGMERCLETGPGKVLTGLWQAAQKTVPCTPVGTPVDLETLNG